MDVPCYVTEWFQLGKEVLESVSEFEIVWFTDREPKGEDDMSDSINTDVKIHAKGSCSAKYQTVHFGVELTVKDVPFEDIEDFQGTLQKMCFERLDDMEPEAQKLLGVLVDDQ